MEGEEEAELQALALEDFKAALAQQGPQEAAATLQSYLAELHGAPEEVQLQLAAAFRQHAALHLAAGGGGGAWAELQALLLRVVGSSSAAVQHVQGVGQDAVAALLYGQEGEAATAAVQRLQACRDSLAGLLGVNLRSLPPPATHQQRRSMLACLLHLRLFQPPGLLPAALQALSDLAAPPWFGRDLPDARRQQAAAFEAFAAVVQHAGARRRLTDAQCQAALRFLHLFRPPLPAVADTWWAHFAALLRGLVWQAVGGGAAALTRAAPQTLARSLCCLETAHMVVPLVLAHPAFQPGPEDATAGPSRRKKGGGSGASAGAKRGLATAAALLAHNAPAFLAGCCELLRPEVNCTLQTRVEALAAMDRAAASYLDACEGQEEGEGAALRLWPAAALDQLLFVLRADPSIRVRREAMRLLSSSAAAGGSPQEAALLRAVLLRCRDKDDAVRREAFSMLAQFPQASLERQLALPDWQTLLDIGLAGPLPSAGGGAKAASKHAAAIRGIAVQLLQRYLGLGKEGGGGGGAAEGDADSEGGGHQWVSQEEGTAEEQPAEVAAGQVDAAGNGRSDAWLHRLQELQLPATRGSTCAVALHLQAAWDAALAECGIHPAGADGV